MTLDWIDDPRAHVVQIPLQPNERCTKPGDYVEVTARYSHGCFITLEADFSRENCGRSVVVQALFSLDDEGISRFEATRRVEFKDDGTVVGYGNRSKGVRFQRKRYEIAKAQRILISAWVA